MAQRLWQILTLAELALRAYLLAMDNAETPAGAIHVGPWQLDGGNARTFQGTTRAAATGPDGRPILVQIVGEQDRDGTLERYIRIGGEVSDALGTGAAIALAADLQAATDEIETLGMAALRETFNNIELGVWKN